MTARAAARGGGRILELTEEARELVHDEFSLARDTIGRSEVDRVIADLKYRLVKKLDAEALEFMADPYACEVSAVNAEEAAIAAVEMRRTDFWFSLEYFSTK